MTDDEFLRAFFRGWPEEVRFGHYEHLGLAWLVIDRHGPELAERAFGYKSTGHSSWGGAFGSKCTA